MKAKDNVEVNPLIFLLELSFIFVGIAYGQLYNTSIISTITCDICGKFETFDADRKMLIDKMFTMVNPIDDSNLSFNFLISCIII